MASVEGSEAVASGQTESPADPQNGSVVATTGGSTENGQVQPQQQPQQGAGGWGVFKTILVRMFIIYLISSFFRKGSQPPQAQKADGSPNVVLPASNVFVNGTMLDMYVYVTETEKITDYGESSLFWLEEELEYGDWYGGPNGDGAFEKSGQIEISERVQNNGSLYLHVFFVKSGHSPNPADTERYSKKETVYRTKQLNKFKKRRYHTLKNLLTGTTDVQPDLVRNETLVEILSHWHPNLTINLIDDHTAWVPGAIPSPLDEYVEFLPGSVYYYPIVYFNDYWNLNQDYMPINSSSKTLNLTLTYGPLSLFRWQMYAAQGMRSRWYSFLGDDLMESSDEDQDSLKLAFLDTNPYLLAITIVVSIVHSVFEFLAFKNDIQFWRNRKSLEGLSVRSVFFNVFQSVIVLLYVMDNETNFVIKVSIFIGLGIEIWKIQKVLDIKLDRENKLFGLLPRIHFQDKSTYTESQTKKYDLLAFKYLSWLLFPLLVLYAIYSVLYLEHKGWYSWVLGMMYGFLLTFGFIMMTPQLFINYKLKSVAHLPWRMLTYKALNTFIDDLFAFVIRMPMLYRLGCFRDDIIFCIYVYQRWIYRVDPKRVNEFGTSGDMFEEPGALEGSAAPALEGSAAPALADSTQQNGAIVTDGETATSDIPEPPPPTTTTPPKSKSAKKKD